MNQIIHSENKKRAVVITSNTDEGPFDARLYVNCNPAFPTHAGLGDATLCHKKATKARMDGLMLWVKAQLAA